MMLSGLSTHFGQISSTFGLLPGVAKEIYGIGATWMKWASFSEFLRRKVLAYGVPSGPTGGVFRYV
jgi:hypothetical protein